MLIKICVNGTGMVDGFTVPFFKMDIKEIGIISFLSIPALTSVESNLID